MRHLKEGGEELSSFGERRERLTDDHSLLIDEWKAARPCWGNRYEEGRWWTRVQNANVKAGKNTLGKGR